MKLSTEKKVMDLENRLVVAKGEGEGEGEGEGVRQIGNLGLEDADYCHCYGLAMTSCCAALGTMSSHL